MLSLLLFDKGCANGGLSKVEGAFRCPRCCRCMLPRWDALQNRECSAGSLAFKCRPQRRKKISLRIVTSHLLYKKKWVCTLNGAPGRESWGCAVERADGIRVCWRVAQAPNCSYFVKLVVEATHMYNVRQLINLNPLIFYYLYF